MNLQVPVPSSRFDETYITHHNSHFTFHNTVYQQPATVYPDNKRCNSNITSKTMIIDRNPTSTNDEGISDNLPVAIPLGDAIEPEIPIVIYDNSRYGSYTGQPATTDASILDATPISTRSNVSPSTTSTKISSFAIASLVLGITSMMLVIVGMVLGILAIVFGMLAIHLIRHRPSEYRGLCMAYSGIITGTIATVLWVSVFAVVSSKDTSESEYTI